MDQFTIFCTPDQTKRAIDLGAPIIKSTFVTGQKWMYIDKTIFLIPTAEQLIGFMFKHKGLQALRIIHYPESNRWGYTLIIKMHSIGVTLSENKDQLFSSQPEATLGAIDAILDFLKNETDPF